MQIEVSKTTFDKLFGINTAAILVEDRKNYRKTCYANCSQKGFILENHASGIRSYHLLDINS